MVYIIFGSQSYSIQYQYKKIAKEVLKEVDELNYVKLDSSETSFLEIIDEATSIPLGYDYKVVVVTNCNFLVKESKTLKEDKEYKEFISYIKNNDENTILILTVNENAIDTRGEIYNIVNVKGKILGLNEVSEQDWITYVESYIKKNNGTIDRQALYELAKRTGGDVALLRNTVDKLLLYNPTITLKEVNLFVVKPLEDNVFAIYNNLISNHSDIAVKIYRDLVAANVEPISIIGILANQFRLLHQVMFLVRERKTNKDIATILNIKETRASIIAKQVYNISDNKIKETLEGLYQLDLQIKSGLVDRIYALELFLIRFNEER